MPQNQGRRNADRSRSGRNRAHLGQSGRQVIENLDESSPTVKMFLEIKEELDNNHNCYERIVKQSRDATIESKRIIFLLHSIDRESKRETILSEAEERVSKLSNTVFRKIAEELHGKDPYDFWRAYTSGLQEYIEAVTFLSYIKDKTLPHWKEIQANFVFNVPEKEETKEEQVPVEKKEEQIPVEQNEEPVPVEQNEEPVPVEQKEEPVLVRKEHVPESGDASIPVTITAMLTPLDYILGVADLTGELMRLCINSLGMGNTSECFEVCHFGQRLSRELSKIGNVPTREYGYKMHTFNQSLSKMESTCYNIVVRGEEVPKSLLAVSLQVQEKQPDEGFCD